MEECLSAHPHQSCVGGEQARSYAEKDGPSAQTIIGQSPGSLFVSQALLKQKPQVHHTTNTKAVAKHNLELSDFSDFAFASFHPASHPPAKSTQCKLPSFTQPVGAGHDLVPSCQERSATKPGDSSTEDRYA